MSEFDKAVKHVKTCLFWDFVDGQWLEKLYMPLDKDFFNWLMQGVVEAHEAENAKLREQLEYDRQTSRSRLERIDQLKAENAKLRELCMDYDKTLDIAIKGYVGIDKPLLIGANQTALHSRMYELGVEVTA